MQDLTPARPLLEDPASAEASPNAPPSPQSSTRSMFTAAEILDHHSEDSIFGSSESDSWVTANPGESSSQADPTESTPAFPFQLDGNIASNVGDGEQAEPGAFGPVSTSQSPVLGNQPEVSTSQSHVPTRDLNEYERLLERLDSSYSSSNDEDAEEPGNSSVADPPESSQNKDESNEQPATTSAHEQMEESDDDLELGAFFTELQAGEPDNSPEPEARHAEPRHVFHSQADELAGLDALIDRMMTHPITTTEVLIGRDPDEANEEAAEPSARGPTIVSSNYQRPSVEMQEDINDPSSTDFLGSHSSDEFEGLAFNNTPVHDDQSETPEPPHRQQPVPEAGPSRPRTPRQIRHERYQFRPGTACHHDSILKYWLDEENPDYVCDYCGLPARFLMACTADTPDYSAYDSDAEIPRRDISILADWMQEAIRKGEYTSEQVEKLLDQRMAVLTSAARLRREASGPERASRPEGLGTFDEWLEQTAEEQGQAVNNPSDDANVRTNSSSGGAPCRRMWCTRCSDQYLERTFGLIDPVVNEPYKEPPQIPEYLNRPISDAEVLSAMPKDRSHWVWDPFFRRGWRLNRYSSGHDALPLLKLIVSKKLRMEDFFRLFTWIYRFGRSRDEVEFQLTWLRKRTPSQISQYSQSLTDSRFIIPRSSDRSITHRRLGLDPELSISRHPIWEEDESQGEPVETPGWVYLLSRRWDSMNRDVNRRRTRLFSTERGVLARQHASSSGPAAPSQAADSPQEPSQEPESPQQAADFDDLYDASDIEN